MKKNNFKKLLSGMLVTSMAFGMAMTGTYAKEVTDGWVTTGDNGKITTNKDGTFLFEGTTAEDNAKRGPYSKATNQSLADGDIVNSVKVYIDPQNMEYGEKVGLTSVINGKDGQYKTEYRATYYADGAGKVFFDTGYDNKIGSLTQAGLYELEIRYTTVNDTVHAQFRVLRNGICIVQSPINNLNLNKDEVTTAGTFWFYDITDEDGVRVGAPTYVAAKDQEAPKYEPADWEGAKVEIVDENTAILNSDQGIDGSYVKKGATSLKDGAVIEEINLHINPAKMKDGEHFALTVSLNDKDGNYATELQPTFVKKGDKVEMYVANNKSPFTFTIADEGIYTLKVRFDAGEFYVFGNLEILNNGKSVAKSENIVMDNITAATAGERRSVWFNEIDVENGVTVYTNTAADYTKVEEALEKVPADLTGYTEETVEALNKAVAAVVYGQDLLHQKDVDKFAEDILAAIEALEEVKDENPEEKPDEKPEEKPGEGDKDPVKPDDKEEDKDTTKPSDDKKDDDIVDTGDYSAIASYVATASMAGLGAGISLLKKKEEDEE